MVFSCLQKLNEMSEFFLFVQKNKFSEFFLYAKIYKKTRKIGDLIASFFIFAYI
jgi:hypothetical protein